MPDFDTAANAQIDSGAFAPARLIFVDFLGDPLRRSTCGRDLAFSDTGDPDLDGYTFSGFDGSFVTISDVSDSTDGSDTLTITLSGVKTVDDTLMALIADKANWQGRLVRLWKLIFDVDGSVQQGAVAEEYTGYGSKIVITPGPQASTIAFSVEKYLASSTQASNRTWLAQSLYDPLDTSAAATMAAANMGRGAPGGGAGGTGGGGAGVTNQLVREVSV